MATPLLWKAYQLNDYIYRKCFYKHKLQMDLESEKYKIERSHKKLLLYYIGYASTFVMMMFDMFVVFQYFLDPKAVPFYMAVYSIGHGNCYFLSIGCNHILIKQGGILFEEYFNTLLKFDREIREDLNGPGFFKGLAVKSLVKQELKGKIKKSGDADLLGIVLIGLVVQIWFVGAAFTLVAVILNMDPIYLALGHLTSSVSSRGIVALRVVITQISLLEGCRTVSVVFLPFLSLVKITLGCVRKLNGEESITKALKLYTKLHCIHRFGQRQVRDLAGLIMGVGFVLASLSLWVMIRGWNLFPREFYIVSCGVTVSVFIMIGTVVPLVTSIYEESKHLIAVEWLKRLVSVPDKDKKIFRPTAANLSIQAWCRILRAQEPITFHYGAAKFDKETKPNFYYEIFLKCVDAVLMT